MRDGASFLACLILAGCTAPAQPQQRGAAAQVTPVTVAVVPEGGIASYLYVDNQNSAASDGNSGSPSQPFRTITGAVQGAEKLLLQGVSTKILINPGVYRESVSLAPRGNQTTATLVLEAAQKGTVYLDGADLWTGWMQQGAKIYTHAWPYSWGLAPYPAGWQGNVVLQPIVRRREMVFVNGARTTQVLSAADLADNTFFVSETAGTITLQLPAGTTPASATIEVAVRAPVLEAHVRKNIVFRGLVFRHGASALPNGAAWITDSSGVLLEDCDANLNNWDGLDIQVSSDVTVRRTTAENNGGSGFGGYQLKRALYEDDDTSQNNWRGAQGGYLGWSVAGAKFVNTHDMVLRRYTSGYNQARGLWLDTDSVNISIEANAWFWNDNDGLFIEANEGPISLAGSLSCENTGAGLALANSTDVTVTGSFFSGNSDSQLKITGDVQRTVSNWETGASYNLSAARWTLQSNLFDTEGASPFWLSSPNWAPFLSTLNSDGNVWAKPGDGRGFSVGGSVWALTDWQSRMGIDLDSQYEAE